MYSVLPGEESTVYVLSVVATLPALAVVGLVEIPVVVLVGGVLVGALGGPLVALGFGTLASNTIEGIARSKRVNLVGLGPVNSLAFSAIPVGVPSSVPVRSGS